MQNCNSKFKIFQYLIILLLIILPLGGFIYLLDREFVFSGAWDAETAMDKESRLIEVISDGKKEQISEDVFRSFEKTPVYFNVQAPRVFKTAQIESRFRVSAPLVEAGVVVREETGQIRKTTIYNKALGELTWSRLDDSGSNLVLWQKEKYYSSVGEFLQQSPAPDKIMTVNYDILAPWHPFNYHASAATKNFNVSLRGPQTLYTYLEKENLNWTFAIQDMNRHDGTDAVTARVFDFQNRQVLEQVLADDGEIWGSGKSSALRELKLDAVLPDGVYKIQINAPDDIFIRRFSTSQQKFVFQYVVYLGDTAGYAGPSDPLQVVGQTRSLKFRTPHEEGKQRLNIQNTVVDIAVRDQGYEFQSKARLVNFKIPKPDLKIDFDGFLTLTPDAFFMPKPIGFKWASDLDQFKIGYIIGYYQPSLLLRLPYENWLDAAGEISLDGVDQSKKLKMFLVASSESNSEAPLDLTNLRVVLKKEPFNFRALPTIILDKARHLLIWGKL